MSSSDTSPKARQKASILLQYVEFTPEIEAALDEVWAEIANELQGAPFETDDTEGDEDGSKDEEDE